MRPTILGIYLTLLSIPAALAAPLSDSTPFEKFTVKQITLPKQELPLSKLPGGGTGVAFIGGKPKANADFKELPFCALRSAQDASGSVTPNDQNQILRVTRADAEFNSIGSIQYKLQDGSLFDSVECWFYSYRSDFKPRLTLGDIKRSLGETIKVDVVPGKADFGSENFSMSVSPAVHTGTDRKQSPPTAASKKSAPAAQAPGAR